MNKKELLAQIQVWGKNMEHQKIIDAILALPLSERDYIFTCILAREYNVLHRYGEALELLESVRKDAKGDPNWFFHYGFSLFNLKRFAEAKGAFQRVLKSAPNHTNVLHLLKSCEANLEREAAWKAYGTGEDLDEDKTLEFILKYHLHNHFEVEDKVEEDHIYIPAWKVSIYPEISDLQKDAVAVTFNIECPDWDRDIVEVSAAKGQNPAAALAVACSSFMMSLMNAVSNLGQKKSSLELDTTFAGENHHWKVYRGNLLTGGDAQKHNEFNTYWDALKDELVKRIGNQKMVYVKIYASRNGDNIKADCRINNIRINSLSNIVGRIAEGWDCPGYGVQRQFFIFCQDDATFRSYPHSMEDLDDYTREVMKLFHEVKSAVDADVLYQKVVDLCGGDKTLAKELMIYIPMTAAENAFSQLLYPETVTFDYQEKGEKVTVYRSQLAAFHPIQTAVMWALQYRVFGEETEAVYQTLIAASPLAQFLNKGVQAGQQIKPGMGVGMNINVEPDFQIR